MKFTSLLFLIFFQVHLFAQPQWKAHIITEHPEGFLDTVIVGCDPEGAIGFQTGLDVLDTIFDAPIAIGSHDPTITEGSTCVNLREDFRAFQDGQIIYTLYLLSTANDLPGGNDWTIRWDTADFVYNEGDYYLQEAYFLSYNGYIGAIDGTDLGIAAYTFSDDRVVFNTDESTPLIGFSGNPNPCDDLENHILLLDLMVGFNVFPVGIEHINGVEMKVFPNPFSDLLNIRSNYQGMVDIRIHDLRGRLLTQRSCSSFADASFNVSSLSQGVYVLSVYGHSHSLLGTYLIKKI